MVSCVISHKMEVRSGCETMQKLRRWRAHVKMAMSDCELLPLEGAINDIWHFFCFSVKDGQFVKRNKKMNEVANMQAVFPGAQVCFEHNQHVVPLADSPPP